MYGVFGDCCMYGVLKIVYCAFGGVSLFHQGRELSRNVTPIVIRIGHFC